MSKNSNELKTFESIMVKLIMTREDIASKLIPYVKPEYFNSFENKELVQSILKYHGRYGRVISEHEMKLVTGDKNVYDHFVSEIMEKQYEVDDSFIMTEIEEYIRDKMTWDVISDMSQSLGKTDKDSQATMSEASENIRLARSFSFDTRIGTEIFTDASTIHDKWNDVSIHVPSGLRDMDKIIKGGLPIKALTIFLGACVTGDTMVKIRKVLEDDEGEYYDVTEEPITNVNKYLESNTRIEVFSPDGWVRATCFVNKGEKVIIAITVDGITTKSSFEHKYQTRRGWTKAEQVRSDDEIMTPFGFQKVQFVEILPDLEVVYDITVDHDNHRYFTNNLSSHNTNIGKTLIKCSLATNMILQNKNVLFVTHEMAEEKISERILANLLDRAIDDLTTMKKDQFLKLMDGFRNKIKSKLYIKEYPTKTATTNNIRHLLKELKDKKGFVPEVIFNDSINIMLPSRLRKGFNTNDELRTISEDLRGLAVEFQVPVISSMQVTRDGMKSSELEITDVAESIGTTTVADVIFGLTQSEELFQSSRYAVQILKNRYGPRFGKFYLGVDYTRMRLIDTEQDETSVVNVVDNKKNKDKDESELDKAAEMIFKTKKDNTEIKKNKLLGIDA